MKFYLWLKEWGYATFMAVLGILTFVYYTQFIKPKPHLPEMLPATIACVGGVQYFAKSMTPKLSREGDILECEEGE